jgi:D-alanyl-lipoteichoic acid acyltransferase DltB (MBOAT superfamily)
MALRQKPTVHRLWAGISFNILLLVFFKYIPSLPEIFSTNLLFINVLHTFFMPIGISFWTFQALSYLFDLYQEKDVAPSLLEFCLYLAFWPTVLSGPVCRLSEMLYQFRQAFIPNWEDVAKGTERIIIGLFMKIVLAQLLANGISPGEGIIAGFDQINRDWGGMDVWLLALGFGFQLFFDFAGYSHIVIGAARLFGFKLQENFDKPYFSATPSIFWTRWHMSLSFWIRDYVFLPFATMRRGLGWLNCSLILSMTLFGLWHGATLPFILWGFYQGCLLALHRQFQKIRKQWRGNFSPFWGTFLSWCLTFMLITLGWIFFRANNISQVMLMLAALFNPTSYGHMILRPNFYIITPLIILGYFIFSGCHFLLDHFKTSPIIGQTLWLLSPLYYAIIILLITIWSKQVPVFIYFQF